MWPLVAEMFFDRKLSVGPPFFNAAFTPFMLVLGLILPIGSALAWKRAKLKRVMGQLKYVFILALAIAGLVWAMQSGRSMLGPVGVFLASWVLMGTGVDLAQRTGRGTVGARLRRSLRLPRADWGKAVAHGGLGITMMGVAGLTAWTVDDIRVAKEGEPYDVGAYTLTLNRVSEGQGPNYIYTPRGGVVGEGWPRDHLAQPRKAGLPGGSDAHHRSGDPPEPCTGCVCGDRRCAIGRWLGRSGHISSR